VGGALALLVLAVALSLHATAQTQGTEPSLRQLTKDPAPARPHFTLPDIAGMPLTLHEQRGRVVVVHFFATWCDPCRGELASLSRLVRGLHGERIAVVAVSVAEVPVRVRRFLETSPVSFPVVLDADRAVARVWGVDILPTTFVLDPRLRPSLLVEGDLDWSRPDVLSALAAICDATASATENSTRPKGRSQ
jgi:peroxiredoxin